MKKINLIRLAVRASLRVRGGILGPLFFIGSMILIEGSLWKSLSMRGSVGNYEVNELLCYSFLAIIISQLVSVMGDPDALSEWIEDGYLETRVLRPLNISSQLLLIQSGHVIARLTFVLPLATLVCLYFLPQFSIIYFFAGFSLAFIGALINATINQLLASLTFSFREAYGFVIVKETLFWILGGVLLPLDLFSGKTADILQNLPFSYVLYIPVKVMTGQEGHLVSSFLISLSWLFFLQICLRLYFKNRFKLYQGYGGLVS